MPTSITARLEWLEADGRGGFAPGTAAGTRTHRYPALLLVATTPSTGRLVLVNAPGRHAITSQRYASGVTHPEGTTRVEGWS